MTQKQIVLDHLRNKGSLTTLVASDEYRICRLSERVRELERDGHIINHTRVERNGKHYMSYSLIEYGQRAA